MKRNYQGLHELENKSLKIPLFHLNECLKHILRQASWKLQGFIQNIWLIF